MSFNWAVDLESALTGFRDRVANAGTEAPGWIADVENAIGKIRGAVGQDIHVIEDTAHGVLADLFGKGTAASPAPAPEQPAAPAAPVDPAPAAPVDAAPAEPVDSSSTGVAQGVPDGIVVQHESVDGPPAAAPAEAPQEPSA